ncbi:formate/nitrite transporter family protein [Tenacibaculum finnmarkense]|uniref:formate/nitrite transporter family protein n=1 Tax=Tenacibaculum finnmarkense TaxID=2781243 RepID=UPI001E2C696B|nr:formate/nitrite transporter family protein [Tenacibaculum finnmarkense]MCD8399522.1 formate/nitrite transporter family protein [Tenacibaculum finnmarkense genomovar ulcerans]MCD8408779.1 formate/nitrite transporter family protein [Tenacibaculum finnmarkense genomovar ulcerans]MCG8761247.1 formate/nitrite transporter family protein [Tenacibaculum finnmarkense]MCG8785016.1 formate/nitrite transporter family protein [Tenacibaculum finnmarkense]MCG8786621.1 formate/nitrite transporter family pr
MSTKVFSPEEIVNQTLNSSVKKVEKSFLTSLLLGILAGSFIGLGALFYTIVKSDQTYSFATKQILGGFVFSLGLILVIIAGAELFTGNNLIAIAWAEKKVSTKQMMRNWGIIFFSNMIGAISLAVMVYFSGHLDMNNGAIAETYLKMADAKCNLPFMTAFFRGILCNILVCLGVWMAMGGKTITDKILAIVFPITLFVAAGFEHSIANLFIIPLGLLIKTFSDVQITTLFLSISGMIKNLIPVILGNIIGGSVFIGLMYHLIFLNNKKTA